MATVLALTVDDMALWTAMDWRPLHYGVLLATRIALTLNAVSPNGESSARLEEIASWLDELISRTKGIRSMMHGGGQFFLQLCEAWERISHQLRLVKAQTSTQARTIQTDSVNSNSIGDMNSAQPAVAWTFGQEMPWGGFENEDPWAGDASWLAVDFAASENV